MSKVHAFTRPVKVGPAAARRPARVVSVTCAPCEGTGAEVRLSADGSLALAACFWCDGRGVCESEVPAGRAADPTDPDPVKPIRCPACVRPMVPVGGDVVCPDCTRFTAAGCDL